MNRNQSVGILLAGLWLASLSPAGASVALYSFSGDLAPGNWTAQNIQPAEGSYVFNNANSLTISASADNALSDVILTSIPLTQASSITLDWSVTLNGGSGVVAYCYAGGTQYDLTDGSGVLNLVNEAAGSTISFELQSTGTSPGKDAATLDLEVVPEAGTWLAGTFVLGVFGFETWRRKSGARANLSA